MNSSAQLPYKNVCLFCIALGEGNFGCVRKARAKGIIPGNNVRNIVAVKTLKGRPAVMACQIVTVVLF